MISALAWVPAGVADPNPKKYEMSEIEQELLAKMQEGQLEEEPPKPKEAKKLQTPAHNLPADLRMDEYSSDEDVDISHLANNLVSNEMLEEHAAEQGDDDDDEENDSDDEMEDDLADVPDTREYEPVNVEGLKAMKLGGNITTAQLGDEDEDDSDLEDTRLTADDAVFAIAKTEDDFASLEVHVYDQKTGNLFVHHDIPLPAYPLCLAHGQVSASGTTGNFCAVGTFLPGIEIWNLDVINALEPSCVLGGENTTEVDETIKEQIMRGALGGSAQVDAASMQPSNGLLPGSHKDAVIALSWNTIHKQVLASGSADCTVKLWDVTMAGQQTEGKCNASTFTHHSDKVQSVEWHPTESTLLATGSYDQTAALLDARSNGSDVKVVKLSSDCECIAWDPFHSEYLTLLSDDGTMTCWDVRKFDTKTPLWSFAASKKGGITSMSYNTRVPGLMATCSIDATVTIWDAYANGAAPSLNAAPQLRCTKDMCVGKLYTVGFYPSTEWLLGCGGSGNQVALWDMSDEGAIQSHFNNEARKKGETNPMPPQEETSPNEKTETAPASKKNKKKTKKKVKKKGR